MPIHFSVIDSGIFFSPGGSVPFGRLVLAPFNTIEEIVDLSLYLKTKFFSDHRICSLFYQCILHLNFKASSARTRGRVVLQTQWMLRRQSCSSLWLSRCFLQTLRAARHGAARMFVSSTAARASRYTESLKVKYLVRSNPRIGSNLG